MKKLLKPFMSLALVAMLGFAPVSVAAAGETTALVDTTATVKAAAPNAAVAAKISVPEKITVEVGKPAKLKITAKGYKVKKVACVSEAFNVDVKPAKKAVTITAHKGTEGQSDFLVTTVKAKKGKNTKEFTFYTDVHIKGDAAETEKHISSLEELKVIDAGSASTKYVLDSDIDMAGWTEPLRNVNCSIDGAGHTLRNLSVPFVGKVWGGTIENLTFELNMTSVYSYSEDDKYAAPVGYLGPGTKDEGATVKNCKSTGSIKIEGSVETGYKSAYIGGLVGDNPNNYGLVANCVNEADLYVHGDFKAAVGGIIGYADGRTGEVSVQECANYGTVDAEVDNYMDVGIGGIVGYGGSFAIAKDCLNAGTVTGIAKGGSKKDQAGGILGCGDYCLENCVSSGKASFGVYGGVIDKDILDSWASSAVMFKNVYYSATIDQGFNWSGNPVEVSGVSEVSSMTDQASFPGLDFGNVWKMGQYGPELKNLP
jgi:hypothetical protein